MNYSIYCYGNITIKSMAILNNKLIILLVVNLNFNGVQ